MLLVIEDLDYRLLVLRRLQPTALLALLPYYRLPVSRRLQPTPLLVLLLLPLPFFLQIAFPHRILQVSSLPRPYSVFITFIMPILSITQIRDGFIHHQLQPIVGPPCYASLKILKEQANDNAGTVFSTGGNGLTGCLRVVLTATEYADVSNTPFDIPVHPGLAPVFPPGNVTAAEREDIRADHNAKLKHFTEYNLVDAAIKAQIIAALEPQHIAALRLPTTNFITRTALDFLTYLFATYAIVGPMQLVQNTLNMQEQWNRNSPIANLWSQIEACVDVARYGGVPIVEATQVNSAIANLTGTGQFRQEITEWNRRPNDQKTWALLKVYFNRVELEQDAVNPPGAGAGGYAAHVAALASDRDDALALAAQSYQANQTMHTAIATLTTQLAALQRSVDDQSRRPRPARRPPAYDAGRGRGEGRGGSDGGDRTNHRARHFCWTHGPDCEHPSHTCNDPGAGHRNHATRANPMGSAHA